MKTLIKLGGAALREPSVVASFCAEVAEMKEIPIVVHGGGPDINKELQTRGITWRFEDGQRVTTPEMMDVIEMVLCGRVNRRIVRALNGAGVLASGLSGTDAKLLMAERASPSLGQVGKVVGVNGTSVQGILDSKAIPVIAPIAGDDQGQAYNINADWAAASIAQALKVDRVIFLTDQEGILDADGKLIQKIDRGGLSQLIDGGVVQGGMLTKVRAILNLLNTGIQEVLIRSAQNPGGTLCLI